MSSLTPVQTRNIIDQPVTSSTGEDLSVALIVRPAGAGTNSETAIVPFSASVSPDEVTLTCAELGDMVALSSELNAQVALEAKKTVATYAHIIAENRQQNETLVVRNGELQQHLTVLEGKQLQMTMAHESEAEALKAQVEADRKEIEALRSKLAETERKSQASAAAAIAAQTAAVNAATATANAAANARVAAVHQERAVLQSANSASASPQKLNWCQKLALHSIAAGELNKCKTEEERHKIHAAVRERLGNDNECSIS